MLNSLTISTPLPTTASALHCSCFGDLQDFFFFFSTGTTLHPQQLHTGSTVAMAISMAERERESKNK